MSTTRFTFLNRIEASTCTLLNGTGGGAPALDEVSGYPTSNTKTSDRYTLWKQSSGAGTINVDFDLLGSAANVGINVAALLGHRPTTAAGSGIASVTVQTQTNAVGYAPAGVWTTQGTITMGATARDGGVGFADASIRYVRFALSVTDAFTLGRFFIGAVETDFLCRYLPGMSRGVLNPRRENIAIGEAPVLNWLGDAYESFGMAFMADTTLRNKLDALAKKRQTAVYIDHNSVFREVLVQRYSDAERWAADDLFDAQLDMMRMP